MRHFLVITLACSLLMQTFSKGLVVLNFYVHRDYIAQNLCERKDLPESECRGSCQLSKELKKEHQKEQSQSLHEKQEIVLFLPAVGFNCSTFVAGKPMLRFPFYNDKKQRNHAAEIFHPPALA